MNKETVEKSNEIVEEINIYSQILEDLQMDDSSWACLELEGGKYDIHDIYFLKGVFDDKLIELEKQLKEL